MRVPALIAAWSLFFVALPTFAQDLPYAKKVVDTLTSPEYWGRGYLHNGMGHAADYIANELKILGVKPLRGTNYFQNFEYSINTFPGKVEVKLNGTPLVPGLDYLVTADSSGRKATSTLIPQASGAYQSADGYIYVTKVKKLTFDAAGRAEVKPTTMIQLNQARITAKPETIEVNIENIINDHFKAKNLAAIIPGTENPDKYLVVSAHYDHLGGLGDYAYFPGANDNASGVAFLLNLAKYYQAHPQKMSIVFLFFAGEEAGLIGSKYFVEHPLIDLKKIRFLINFDMVGTGDTGITAVNATVFPTEFDILKATNAALPASEALAQVGSRGEAANSDHYFFTRAGVPAFFIYTMGGIAAYHDIFDQSSTLPYTKFETLFKLTTKFHEKLAQ
ncbi:MAG: Zn-dependent exopeptidase M28 [Bdellovibrionales bacterium]|nr:Zn-dependent exopeptidase M28 [Bdellovibrionales bacterium]